MGENSGSIYVFFFWTFLSIEKDPKGWGGLKKVKRENSTLFSKILKKLITNIFLIYDVGGIASIYDFWTLLVKKRSRGGGGTGESEREKKDTLFLKDSETIPIFFL